MKAAIMARKRSSNVAPESRDFEAFTKQSKETPVRRGIKLLNDAQREAWRTIDENRIAFITGASGAGKSQVAFGYATEKTHHGDYEKIIVTRPLVEAAGEQMGFQKGSLEEKTLPYLNPALVVAKKCGYQVTIEFLAIAFARGVTFEDVIVVVDEAQNCSVVQLRLILSRLGPNSKIVLCGDDDQRDVNDSGLSQTIAALQGVPGIGFFEFQESDIVRDPLIGTILARMKPLR